MKRLLTTLGLGLACLTASAQSGDPAYPAPPATSDVVAAEVMIDFVSSVGSGTPVTITAGGDITTTTALNTASLAPGIHKIFLRSRSSAGDWSLTTLREFLVDYNPAYAAQTALASDIIRAEYFINTDPGKGLGIPITLTPGTNIAALTFPVSTTGLSTGFHRVYVRTQNAAGLWSVPEGREFAVTQDYAYPPAASQTLSPVVRAEYFIDTDPGYGAATPVSLTAGIDVPTVSLAVNTSGLSVGVHQVGLRTQDAAGQWTATSMHELLVTDDHAYPAAPAAVGAVANAEYFIDNDPGFGQGTPIALSPGADIANASFTVNTTGLAAGLHTLYIRSRQNLWSLTTAYSFSVSSPLPVVLTRFSAVENGREVLVGWEVSEVESIRDFEVERSAEGRVWSVIGTVSANGRGTYDFKDAAPLSGRSFYRLKMTETAGGVTYSGAQSVHFGTSVPDVQLWPNPTASRLFVDGIKAGASLEVWSTAGTLVARFTGVEKGGYDVSTLPAGIYLLRVTEQDRATTSLRFAKQ